MSSKYKVNNHSVLKVSNDEAKQGASWHDIARGRAFKQHPTGELSDKDIHSVPKIDYGPQLPEAHPEETEETLHTIEDQIKLLQANEQEKARVRAEQDQKKQQQQSMENDPYDDWFKE
jgi:hypothetical protein